MAMTAVPMQPEDSGQAMIEYAHRNPRAAKELMRICGYKVDGSDEDYYILGRDIIPFIILQPRGSESIGRSDQETEIDFIFGSFCGSLNIMTPLPLATIFAK